MNDTPTLPAVVPTRERHVPSLSVSIRSPTTFDASNFQVAVHENGVDPSGFDAACGDVSDSQLRYVHRPAPVSITAKFEDALRQARGKYACTLGHEDDVTESVVELARSSKPSVLETAVAPAASIYGPDSPILALRAARREGLVARWRINRLHAACPVFNPRCRSRVLDARTRGPQLVWSVRPAVAVAWASSLRISALLNNIRAERRGLYTRGAPISRESLTSEAQSSTSASRPDGSVDTEPRRWAEQHTSESWMK